jgi:hypothetical protein
VCVEVAFGIGDEAGLKGAELIRAGAQRARGELFLGVRDRDGDLGVRREPAPEDGDGVGGVIVSLVDRQLGGLGVALDEAPVWVLLQIPPIVSDVEAVVEMVIRVDVPRPLRDRTEAWKPAG